MNALLRVIADHVGAAQPDQPEDPVQAAIVQATSGEKPAETVDDILNQPIRERYRYANGIACSANDAEKAAFDAYLQAEKKRPADVDALRAWVQDTPKPRA